MAANKFATMLHRNTNKITMILIYAVLEWTLIVLLLLNSLFSYLIIKFAQYFGLKQPCLWCSRVDHIFEPRKNMNMHRDLLCEAHAKEISRLGFCSNHQNLAASQDMCEDCLSSRPEFREASKIFTFFGMIHTDGEKVVENGHVSLNCSCCGVTIDSNKLPQIVIKPSWDLLEFGQKGELVEESWEDDHCQKGHNSDGMKSDFGGDGCQGQRGYENKDGIEMVFDINGDFCVRETEADEDALVSCQNSNGLKSDFTTDGCEIENGCVNKDGIEMVFYVNGDFSVRETEADKDGLVSGNNSDGLKSDFATDGCEIEHGYDNKDGIDMVCDVNGDLSVRETEADKDGLVSGNNSDGLKSDFATDGCEIEHGYENKDGIDMVFDVNGDFSVRETEEGEDGKVSTSISEMNELKDQKVENVYVAAEEVKEEIVEEKKQDIVQKDQPVQVSVGEDASLEILPQHLEFFIDCTGHQLVPVELMDSATEENLGRGAAKDEEQCSVNDVHRSNSGFSVHRLEAETEVSIEDMRIEEGEDAEHSVHMNQESKFCGFESIEIEEDETSLVFYAKGCSDREVVAQEAKTTSQDSGDVQEQEAAEDEEKLLDVHPDCEDIARTSTNESEADVSIGTEIPDLDIMDEIQGEEDPSTSSFSNAADGHDVVLVQEHTIELNALSVNLNEHLNKRSSVCSDLNEVEEDKFPDTPTSGDSFYHLHKKLLQVEKKDSGTEDSLDGSIFSELESGDGTGAVEQLKSALRAERKALHAIYAELEEERNASAIAANQTMAMINRLQEEKAAMQMEALQYQRMMEEQAEYDQEALQLLNELMIKREREKEELEKELEIYRKKVLEYETREKLRMLRKSKEVNSRSGFSSPSCSNAEDSDAASIDLNQEAKEEDDLFSNRECDIENTPVNAVLNLEESIADFEEERMSILEQLKVLEVKLMTLDDDDLKHFEDVTIKHHEENGHHIDENGHLDGLANGHANGFDSNGTHKSSSPKFEFQNQRLGIDEELDLLHERLQALEGDREFLKHCISSLNKGDKGMHLLHEILQHLKDLKNVELRVRNLSDGIVI